MYKVFLLASILFLGVSSGFAQVSKIVKSVEKTGEIAPQVERAVSKHIAQSYVAQPITRAVQATVANSTINVSPSVAVTLKKHSHDMLFTNALLSSPTSSNWKDYQKQFYYSVDEREGFQQLLTSDLPKMMSLRPEQLSLENYIYDQIKNNNSVFIEPLYHSFLLKELKTTPEIIPYATGAAFSPHEKRLDPRQLGWISSKMMSVISSSSKILQFVPNDPYAMAVHSFYVGLYKKFDPLLGSLLGDFKLVRLDGRNFNFEQFFLQDAQGKDYVIYNEEPYNERSEEEAGNFNYLIDTAQRESAILLQNLPKNQRFAVLNDDLEPLQNFKSWAEKGLLGENSRVDTFEDGNDLLRAIKNGARYDMIITDIVVPNGGRGMMPDLRNMDQQVTVLAMSKHGRVKVGALSLFEGGMDGYMPYTPAMNDPNVGYWEFLRAWRNYLDNKALYGWSR